MEFRVLLGSTLLASSALLLPSAAQAQDAKTEKAGEIVVTAQKREQALFDVPMALSAISGREIAERNANQLEDLQYTVPGLSIAQTAPGQEQPQLRGISVFSGLPTVGVYLDELPLNGESSQSGLDVRLVDMQRVEVLRGPQGTLYGQGAVGGTIRYITPTPDLEKMSARLAGDAAAITDGGIDSQIQGMFNAPIMDGVFGLRVAASHQVYGGWIDNVRAGKKDNNAGTSDYLRARALWRLSPKLDASLMLLRQTLDVDSGNVSDNDRRYRGALATPSSSKAEIANLIVTYDLGFARLLSSSGWVDRSDSFLTDLSPLFIPALETPPPFGFGFPKGTFSSIAYRSRTNTRFFTQEIRLSSAPSAGHSWTIGAMYRDSEAHQTARTFNTPDIVPVDLLTSRGTSPSDSVSWSAFGEATWALAPSIDATLGARWFEDRRTQNVASATFGTRSSDRGKAKFSAFSPRANLKWHRSDDFNIYLNVAKGFRSGGFNRVSAGQGVVPIPPTYSPDTLWSYEIGGRFRTPDRRFNGELSVYYNNWTDVQSLQFASGLPIQYVVNGNDLAGFGVDAAFGWKPTENLSFNLTGGYNDLTYQKTTGERIKGDRADYTPRSTFAASASYDFNWASSIPGAARLDYQYTDGWRVFPRNLLARPAIAERQSYLNARLEMDLKRANLALFARNITNENSVTYPAFGALFTPLRSQPRTIGVSVSLEY